MKKQTTIPANQADFSTLEMWLNGESKLFTKFFAEKGEVISRKSALADTQLMISMIFLFSCNFENILIAVICILWFASSVIIVKMLEQRSNKKREA